MPPRTRDIVGAVALSVALVALIAVFYAIAWQSS
jgi:hypothetical protein